MTYEEARSYLDETAKFGSVYGLESIIDLTKRLGNPQDKLKIIHIAGTNGKGSTLAFISTILKKAGYKVGRYISPTVITYRERIQVNEKYITREALAELTGKVAAVVEQIEADGIEKPTAFEIETAIAFMYFSECKCDFAIIETGMGGTMDATNLVKNTICSVIASISMDHMGLLGNSLYEIATNKAGIIKAGAEVVSLQQKPEAMKAIEMKVKECGCNLTLAKTDKIFDVKHEFLKQKFSYQSSVKVYKNMLTGLYGTYQLENAILAIETIEALRKRGYSIKDSDIYEGLRDTVWYGRFTKIIDKPLFIIDGAHNDDAASKLRETIEIYFTNRKKIYIMGVLADKEYDKIIDKMITDKDTVITVTPNNTRALSADKLAEAVQNKTKEVIAAENINDAVRKSIDLATEDSVIIAFGSLYYLGDVIRAVNELKERVS